MPTKYFHVPNYHQKKEIRPTPFILGLIFIFIAARDSSTLPVLSPEINPTEFNGTSPCWLKTFRRHLSAHTLLEQPLLFYCPLA